jgi:SPP1 family predicted phage head-tail adaptor
VSIAGALRERVTLQRFEADETDAGDRYETWIDYAPKIAARMQPKKSSELVRAMREVNETRYVATIRRRADVLASNRLVWGSRTFRIDGVMNLDERGLYLSLDCLEISI